MFVGVYLLGVRTAAGQPLADAAYPGRLAESMVFHVFDKRFLEAIDIRVFFVVAIALLVMAAIRRLWCAGLLVTAAYLAAIVSTEVLKAVLTRPVLAIEMEALMGTSRD